MPRFHFHVRTTVDAHDDEGLDFANLDEAKASAILNARALVVGEMLRDHRFSPNHSIEITDAGGTPLHVTRFGDCLDVRL